MTTATPIQSQIQQQKNINNQQAQQNAEFQESFLATVKKQRETALDTVASLVSERDIVINRLRQTEEELLKVRRINTDLVEEVASLKKSIKELKEYYESLPTLNTTLTQEMLDTLASSALPKEILDTLSASTAAPVPVLANLS